MVMLKSETSTPSWVPEGYRKLGWHAGFDVLIGPMYYLLWNFSLRIMWQEAY